MRIIGTQRAGDTIMSARRTPRLATFDYLGRHRYSLTCCTYRRRRLFTSPEVVPPVLAQISRAAEREQFAVLAYCFMPDHLHLLVAGETPASHASAFVARFKQLSGYWYRRQYGDRLWQRSAWDRVLRSEDDTWVAIRYILANPVRGGLVERPADYPFSGSLAYDRRDLDDAFGWGSAG
jgi:putative transposase